MRSIIFLLLLIGCLSSCVTQKACNRKFPPEVITKDSIIEKVVYKDTTIYIPGETVYDTIEAECDKQGKVVIKNSKKTKGKSTTTTKTEGNKIITTCDCSAEKLTIKKLKEEKTNLKTKTIVQPPIVKKEIPAWALWLFGVLSPFSLLGIIRTLVILLK